MKGMHPALLSFFNTPRPDDPKQTTMDYIAELICINRGNAEVSEFGVVTPDENSPYGRVGLSVNEAFHLCQLINFLKGILWANGSPDLYDKVLQIVKAEVLRKQNKTLIFVPNSDEVATFGKPNAVPKLLKGQ